MRNDRVGINFLLYGEVKDPFTGTRTSIIFIEIDTIMKLQTGVYSSPLFSGDLNNVSVTYA